MFGLVLKLWLLALIPGAAPAPDAGDVLVGFAGDVSFAGRGGNPADVFLAARPELSRPEVMFVNAEGLLLKERAPAYHEARMDISADPRFGSAYFGSGIDVLGLANNHAWDAGARGVIENLGYVASIEGIAVIGAGATNAAAITPWRFHGAAGCLSFVPATLKSNRGREDGAFVAYYGDASGARPLADLLALVRSERAAACAPIVSVHWGHEGKPMPDASVVAFAHELADAGAALVIGHHPHVMQGIAWAGPTPIAWSLGNFVFHNSDADKRRTGVLEVRFARGPDGIARAAPEVVLVPMTIDAKTFAPRPSTNAERAAQLAVMTTRSAPFGTKVVARDERIVFSP